MSLQHFLNNSITEKDTYTYSLVDILKFRASATPDQLRMIFANSKFVGESFGVSLINGIEVSTFRIDEHYNDGRRPKDVIFSTMEEDAKRRDLTINAVFYDPVIEKYIDFSSINGIADINNKIIKFVGNPQKRINEDALRIMRALRFATRFNFKIDLESYLAIRDNAYKVEILSGERIFEELKKGLFHNPKRYMEILTSSGVTKYILPEVNNLVIDTQDPVWHPEISTFVHTMNVLDNIESDDYRIQMAALFHDIGKPATRIVKDGRIRNSGHAALGAQMTRVICKRLKMSNEDIDFITSLVHDHMKFKDLDKMKKSTLRRFINEPHFEALIEISRADALGTEFEKHDLKIIKIAKDLLEQYSNEEEGPAMPKPFITGYDLISLGMKPGPNFKVILDIIMNKQLENEFDGREEALFELQNILGLIEV